MVQSYWQEIQNNIGSFQALFGKKNFLVVDNSDGKDYNTETLRAYKDIRKFTERAPENSTAIKWIKSEKKKRKMKK